MKVKNIVWEDFCNYKKASLFILTPYCSFKCEEDCGEKCCQNRSLIAQPTIDIDPNIIINKYINNPITQSIIFGGMEPFDSFNDIIDFIKKFRKICDDEIIIYSGYTESELKDKIEILNKYSNIIIKFGRFIPHQISHFDNILGIYLASENQYAKQIS